MFRFQKLCHHNQICVDQMKSFAKQQRSFFASLFVPKSVIFNSTLTDSTSANIIQFNSDRKNWSFSNMEFFHRMPDQKLKIGFYMDFFYSAKKWSHNFEILPESEFLFCFRRHNRSIEPIRTIRNIFDVTYFFCFLLSLIQYFLDIFVI